MKQAMSVIIVDAHTNHDLKEHLIGNIVKKLMRR